MFILKRRLFKGNLRNARKLFQSNLNLPWCEVLENKKNSLHNLMAPIIPKKKKKIDNKNNSSVKWLPRVFSFSLEKQNIFNTHCFELLLTQMVKRKCLIILKDYLLAVLCHNIALSMWWIFFFWLKNKCFVFKVSRVLTVCSYHIKYAFQSESTLYSSLNIKKLLARSRREI